MPVRPPHLPQIREEDVADPKKLARLLADFFRQTNDAVREINEQMEQLEARLEALEP